MSSKDVIVPTETALDGSTTAERLVAVWGNYIDGDGATSKPVNLVIDG